MVGYAVTRLQTPQTSINADFFCNSIVTELISPVTIIVRRRAIEIRS